MKKILLFIMAISITAFTYAQFPEDFEGATFPPTGWTQFMGVNGLGTVKSWELDTNDAADKFAKCVWEVIPGGATQRSEDWLVTPQFTVNATNTILSFKNGDSSTLEYGSIYTVRVSTATQTTHADFTIVDLQTETTIGHTFASTEHHVDLAAYTGQAIYVAFVLEQNDGDLWALDDIDMIASGAAPNPVTLLTPLDTATNIYIDPTDGADADTNPDMRITFDWDPATMGDAASSYEVYLGDSATTMTLLGATPNDQVDITGMVYNTTYFWSIVAKNGFGSATGSPVWSFTTEADPATSSVNDDILASSISIYPTATTENFTIKNESNIALTSVSLFDINGRVVFTENLDNLVGEKSINVSNLSAGMYFVELSSSNAKATKKLIKK